MIGKVSKVFGHLLSKEFFYHLPGLNQDCGVKTDCAQQHGREHKTSLREGGLLTTVVVGSLRLLITVGDSHWELMRFYPMITKIHDRFLLFHFH